MSLFEIITDAVTGEKTARPYTQEEIDAVMASVEAQAWHDLRELRNRKLSNSDVVMLPDHWMEATEEQKAAWIAYRQALRDLPQNTTDPFNPVWPVEPT